MSAEKRNITIRNFLEHPMRLVVPISMALVLFGCHVDEHYNSCGFTFAGDFGPHFRPPTAMCRSFSANDSDIHSADRAMFAQGEAKAGYATRASCMSSSR